MFSSSIRITFATVVAILLLTGAAAADQWHISRSSGPVWVGSDIAQLVSLGPATDVPGGATVMTGEGARLFLVRGEQTMLVGPNTVVTLPDGDSKGITTILEQAGEVTFDVDRQKVKHFVVETPYLAAVVKGTNFTVHVDDEGGAVAVNRGLVEVQDLATGDIVDTPVGQMAQVSGQNGRLTVSGSGPRAVIRSGSPRAPLVKSLSRGAVHTLQTAALDMSGDLRPGLTPVTAAPRNDSAVAVVAAAGSGGSGGDDSGGNASGGSGGGHTDAVLTPPRPSAGVAERSFFSKWFGAEGGEGISPQALASLFGLSIALAFGLAYFKGKFG